MHADEALVLLDQLLPVSLSNVQEIVFCQVWQDKTYSEIAEEYNYEPGYIRDIGFRLWQMLSTLLGEKVSKGNVKAVFSRYARQHSSALAAVDRPHPRPIAVDIPSTPWSTSTVWRTDGLDLPHGPVAIHSPFYIERPPIEDFSYAEILKPGCLLRLKGPRQIGKTSLLRRILHHAKSHGFHVITINLHRVDQHIFQDLNLFLRWFCANVSHQLGIPSRLDDYWNSDIGSKVSCTIYLENYILKHCTVPIVVALDEINILFQFAELSEEFLPLLRSWYEDARELECWGRMRWVLSHSTDVYVQLKLSQSPFNVGLPIALPEFSLGQIQELTRRHGLVDLAKDSEIHKLVPLLNIIGRRPGMVRLALHHLCLPSAPLADRLAHLMATVHTQSGIFSDHLRHLLAALQPHHDLKQALTQVIQAQTPLELSPAIAYQLESMGLIKVEGNLATISCGLYQQFFSQYLREC